MKTEPAKPDQQGSRLHSSQEVRQETLDWQGHTLARTTEEH